MRITYPKEIKDEIKAIAPFLTYREGVGLVVRSDAPLGITERHRVVVEKMKTFEQQ